MVRYAQWCRKFHTAKSHSQNTGLFTPFPKPTAPWKEVSMDFVLGLPKTRHGHNSILVVVAFQKMAHFISYSKTLDASHVENLYFQEIVMLHGISKTTTFDQGPKFVGHFWLTLWWVMGTKLQFSSFHYPQTDGKTEVTNRSLGNLLRF